MRRESFRAVLIVGVLVPAAMIAFAATSPGVRALARSFVTPLSSSAGPVPEPAVSALPADLGPTGAESIELRTLRDAESDAGAPRARALRAPLFPTPVSSVSSRLQGLQRPGIAQRDDTAIDSAVAYLARDDRGHGALLAALRRLGPRRAEVEQIFRAWKVPEELVAIALVESGFSTASTTSDGAAGLWSMTREVAGAYQLAVLEKYDERRAVALSSEAAAHYLADLRERFGSWEVAILAFGLGYGETLRHASGHASADFQAIAAGLGPDQAAYVPRVLAAVVVLANPDRFGLDAVGPSTPITTSDLEVPGGTPLTTVARAAGTSIETLRDLNPEYLGNTVPDTGFAMVMHLPSTSLARAKESLMPMLYATSGSALSRGEPVRDRPDAGDQTPTASNATPKSTGGRRVFYHAREGETLDAVASRFGIARETIASDNALDPTAPLRAGQLLTLRLGGSATDPPRTSK